VSNSSAVMVPRLVSKVAVFIGVGVGGWELGVGSWGFGSLMADG
jgi:hypothetical protein